MTLSDVASILELRILLLTWSVLKSLSKSFSACTNSISYVNKSTLDHVTKIRLCHNKVKVYMGLSYFTKFYPNTLIVISLNAISVIGVVEISGCRQYVSIVVHTTFHDCISHHTAFLRDSTGSVLTRAKSCL